MNIEELKNRFQAVSNANTGIETFLFDDLSTINTNRQKKYMVALMKTPNSVMTPFKHTDYEANWENYAITIYFLDTWNNEDKKTVSLEQRYREIEDVANGYIKEVLAQGTNEYSLIGDKSVTKTRGHHQHVDQLVGLQYDFTLRVYVSLCPEVGRAENLTATTISSSQIDLAWVDNSTNESGFEVWRSINCIDWVLITTTAADVITYSDTGLAGNSAFAYRVRAVSGSLVGVYSNIAISNTESSSTPQTGIAYDRPFLSGQLTSFNTYDDSWQLSNGTYDYTPPSFPVSFARLDTTDVAPFFNLIDNNAFGNKDRFTDINGLQVYGDDYVIDHLTGLAYYRILSTGINWATSLTNTAASTQNGFSDWRMLGEEEVVSISNYDSSRPLNYTPFNYSLNNSLWTTLTNLGSTTFIRSYVLNGGALGNLAKTATNGYLLMVRNHYN